MGMKSNGTPYVNDFSFNIFLFLEDKFFDSFQFLSYLAQFCCNMSGSSRRLQKVFIFNNYLKILQIFRSWLK